jgi:hypothetical protein
MSTHVKPIFWLITGADFARSIAWAKRTPNAVSVRIRAAVDALRSGKRP